MKQAMEEKAFLSVADVGKKLSLGVTYTRRLINRGEIKSVRLGKRVLVPRQYLDREFKRFIAQAQVPPLSIHGVRHSVATLAVASGEDVRTIADLLGHDPRVLMTTYAHVLAHSKVEVSNRIGGIVLGDE